MLQLLNLDLAVRKVTYDYLATGITRLQFTLQVYGILCLQVVRI